MSDTKIVGALLALLLAIVIVPVIVGCSSVARQPCEYPGSVRCAGDRLDMCAPDGVWVEVEDCADLEPGEWHCTVKGCHSD